MTKLTLAYVFFLITLATLSVSCEKESLSTPAGAAEDLSLENDKEDSSIAKSGCPDYFAITEAPTSEIIHLQGGSYTVLGSTTLTAYPGGDPTHITDLKGISRFADGGYYVTTGPNNPAPYDNALLEVEPISGNVLRNVMSIGFTVSDICFVDSPFGPYYGFVGLGNNNNSLVWLPFTNSGAPAGMPVGVGLVDIEPGYTASGLTWAYPIDADPNCRQDFQLYITATSTNSNKAFVYEIEPISGQATHYTTFIGQEFQGAHTANGWYYCKQDFRIGHLTKALNAHTFTIDILNCHHVPGPWPNLGTPSPVQPNAYEDFCSEPYPFYSS